MDNFKVGDIVVKFASTNDEIIKLEKFRYQCLLRDYNTSLTEDGIDDDGYDKFCFHVYLENEKTGEIIGTYRVATSNTIKDEKFMTENEFDITNIKNKNETIMELGRAVVHEDYRNGVAIQMLWAALLDFALKNNIKYVIGTGSFHGTDIAKYKNALSYLYYNHQSDESLKTNAVKDYSASINLLKNEEIDSIKAKQEMPPIFKGYLRLGATCSETCFIDYSFNSIDVLLLLDMSTINKRYIQRLTGK